MGKQAAVLALAVASVGAFAGWAFVQGSRLGDGWRGMGAAWPYVLGAGAATAALAIVLVRLAFFSADHGYDERIKPDGP